MINNSSSPPPSPAQPPTPIDPWGDTFLSRLSAVVLLLAYSSCAAVCLYHTARFLLQCLERRRAAREAQDPKPPSQAVDGAGAGAVWAEADCAICLSELDPEGGERVRVLPACGHAYHDACVQAWLATRASCPTCRAPSRSRPSRTTRAP
ncbi:RING-H2 finger protein ATL1I [Zea mays]|uniref:RING-H2 finger protein ATL1I n=1 Tax=Zea mays TaxID=4577 RepID=B6U182_MAIZE|nr:RING-H2 finger protein ATL1I [Zea mays]ACG43115.1 RING-H2 finger protein ATL1I [Zea mays]ONM54746.1 RING-H2 finger protein ATL1I [Zea mays]|eukprot:NP_001151506.1 RING-H2 finger protein ATL1I [Zea mays]